MSAKQNTDVVRELTIDDVVNAYAENKKNAFWISVYLKGMIFLGIYTLIVTLLLIQKSSGAPALLTLLTDQKGAVEKITPNRNPPITDRQAIHWVREHVTDLMSLHFRHYAEQITRRKNYFIDDGWQLYQQSLIDNGVIETLKKESLIITAIDQQPPRLLRKFRLDGRLNWSMEVLVLHTMQGASDETITSRKVITITVEETRRDMAVEGLKIRAFSVLN